MRITHFTQYSSFVLNQQATLSELSKVQTQISSGVKISNIYEDPTIFNTDLRLKEELNSFTQIKSSANFAKTFANHTDTTLNEFVSTLDSFKVKLIQAANDTQNITSREAIVSELKGELEHLKNLANTSINGKYIFSGSMFNNKPIDDNYNYVGNDEKVKAFLGAGVEREYNIDGKTLFLGRDNDYVKHISTNVVQFDKIKANPEFVVRGKDNKLYIDKHLVEHGKIPDSETIPVNEPITANSQIRMLTGVEDIYDSSTDTYIDGTSYFYIKGKKPNGEFINTKFSLSNSNSVNDLLEKIGEIYGNSTTSKVVDVSLNSMGEIQIKDIVGGKMLTDFFIVASDKDRENVEELIKNGDYIVEFQKSDFNTIKNLSTITANNGYFDNRVFEFGSIFKTVDTKRKAIENDTLYNVLGQKGVRVIDNTLQNLDYLKLTGTDTNGNSVNVTLNVTSSTTMKDLMDEIKNNFGDVSVFLENGELEVVDNSISKTETSKFSINISAFDVNNEDLMVFESKDIINFDKLFFSKDANELTSNVSQIVKDYKIYFKDSQKIIIPNENAQTYATKDTSIVDTMGTDEMPQEIKLTFKDINGNLKTAIITLRDTPDSNGHLSNFWIDLNNDGNKNTDEVFDIYTPDGNLTYAHDHITTITTINPQTCEACKKEEFQKGLTYRQLGDIVSMLVSGNLPATNSFEDYNEAIKQSKEKIDTNIDNKGKFFLKDLSNSFTKIDLSIYTQNNSLYFQANNAITIDEPQIDFFETLKQAIKAVEKGNNYPNGDRNVGMQGAIEVIDHVIDHVRRAHAKIGAVSNEFELTIQRTEMLIVHTKTLMSDNIDTDLGEASMQLNSLQLSYQALLSSIAKVNNLTLLNYL
ncbi:MAG TPA: flagellar hook-associated protein FlgL [Nautiliaceae bacterium]|nr:flagellar hook-associated protein FlgL [Nautiliaceae bacterium]